MGWLFSTRNTAASDTPPPLRNSPHARHRIALDRPRTETTLKQYHSAQVSPTPVRSSRCLRTMKPSVPCTGEEAIRTNRERWRSITCAAARQQEQHLRHLPGQRPPVKGSAIVDAFVPVVIERAIPNWCRCTPPGRRRRRWYGSNT
jgi:hypothetical protein